jgi:hypothetical protein
MRTFGLFRLLASLGSAMADSILLLKDASQQRQQAANGRPSSSVFGPGLFEHFDFRGSTSWMDCIHSRDELLVHLG